LATTVKVGSESDSHLYWKKGDKNRLYFLWAFSMVGISWALTSLIFDFGNLPGVAMGDMWDGQKTIVGQLSPVQSFAGNAGRDSPDSFFVLNNVLQVSKITI
jgi:hypothetical protein